MIHSLAAGQQLLSDPEVVCKHAQYPELTMKGRSGVRLADPRLNDYDVTFYFLDLSATNTSTDLEGTTTVSAFATAELLEEFVLELAGELTVTEVMVNEITALYEHENDLLVIRLPETFQAGDRLDVAISYGGTPPSDDGFFSGISQDNGPYGIPVTWTLSEPFNASDWFPVKQVLTDQADSANIYITVPPGRTAAASGLLKNITDMPDNKRRFEWETRYPMAYYLISMAIAPYSQYTQEVQLPETGETLPVLNYLYDDERVISAAVPDLAYTPPMILLFSDLFGPYPFAKEKYGHAMAPMGGGMEHQTMSTMAGFNFTLVAHELMHQWYGNAVTCATWQDIWINEGFARYGEYVAIENLISREQADAWMSTIYDRVLREPAGSVYVPESGRLDPYRIFDLRLTYNKGGALLHMLRFLIGNDELFFNGMRAFADAFYGGTATGDDFRDFMENYTQVPLADFFEQWYYGQGYPVYDMTWTQEMNQELVIRLRQTASHPETTPFFSTPVPVAVQTATGTEWHRLSPSSDDEEVSIPVEGEVLSVELDPRNIILKKTGRITATDPARDFGYRIYPNPARDDLFLEFTSGLSYRVILTDIRGKVIRQRELAPAGTHRITVRDLPAGVYLLQLLNANGRWTERIEIIR